MTVSMSCRRCQKLITADDEDQLVELSQAHASSEHRHTPSREHILAHLRGQDPKGR